MQECIVLTYETVSYESEFLSGVMTDVSEIVAITGGTGFVGRQLIKAVVSNGYTVRILIRDAGHAAEFDDVDYVVGSLSDKTALNALCDSAGVVVHCAGRISARDRAEFDDVNVIGTRNLIDAAVQQNVMRFVHVSSLAAREPALSDYGASKRAGETVVREADPSLTWSILRPPAVYGPRDKGTFPLIQQLSRKLAIVPGSKKSRISLIYVDDLAQAIAALVDADAPTGEIFELHDGAVGGYSWPHLAQIAGVVNRERVRCIYIPKFVLQSVGALILAVARVTGAVPMVTPGKVRELYHQDWACHSNLLDDKTSWRPQVDFRTGYANTVGWYREEGWL